MTNSGGGDLQWNAVATVPWLDLSPAYGTNAGTIGITASAASLSAGSYSGSVVIYATASNAPFTIPVSLTVTASSGPPTIRSGGIVSAAGYQAPLSRGAVATVFGTGLADSTLSASTVPLPRNMAGVTVSVNGVSAPLWFVSPGQINFQVPFEAPLAGQASVVVARGGSTSSAVNIQLTPYAPSVFIYPRTADLFDPIIVHGANNQLITPSSPASPGENIVIYGTGIGDLKVLPATGGPSPTNPLAYAKATPNVTISGLSGKVAFAGLTPSLVGVAQFNVQVPTTVPTNTSQPLIISFGPSLSQPVQLYIAKTSTNIPKTFTIATIAGTGMPGYSGDGGAALSARLNQPAGIAVDSTGNLYVADYGNSVVRKLAPDGTITTVAGNGTAGYSGDGGPGARAQLNLPQGVAADTAGNLYIADYGNHAVRKLVPNGTITTIAGNGTSGYSGDGGLATSAQLSSPTGVAVGSAGNLYISDPGNHVIREVTGDGVITTFAGNGVQGYSGAGGLATAASVNDPAGVGVDSAGNVYFAEAFGQRIRKIAPDGTIATVAGTGTNGYSGDGGPAAEATLSFPWGVAVDSAGNLYISDKGNYVVRMVGADGTIRTIAGGGSSRHSAAGEPATSLELGYPYGLAVDGAGSVYFSDLAGYIIQKLTPQSGTSQ